MPTVTQSDDPSNQLKSPGLSLKDEFIPYVEEDTLKILQDSPQEDGKSVRKVDVDDKEAVKLTEYLDEEFKGIGGEKSMVVLTTNETKFKVPFDIKKGTEKSSDDDGILEFKLDKTYEGVKLLNPETKIKAKYGDKLEVEVEITAEKSQSFYIDFYASDDVGDDWNDGELEDLYCGRLKIVYNKPCICNDDDWPTLPSLVKESEKVLYSSDTVIPWMQEGATKECYHFALHQLKVLGFWLKSERWNKKWDGTKELNDHIYQLSLHSDVAGMKKGVQKEMFKKALLYLKDAMRTKTPVMVGLDYAEGYANDDLITDHFAVITGCGKDSKGRLYFHVIDNAFQYQKYYCNCDTFEIKTIKEDDDVEQFVITQVRESKKL